MARRSRHTRAPWQPSLIYAARGRSALWDEGRASRGGLSAGGVSHLKALRGAGLVTGRREGRSLLYVRTPVADALVDAGEPI